ncbi:zinc finger HIT domain-containing protein 3 isoform X1 [Chanos chanos]|uniref:Zinc finger HIT domain-containing protein 3 n=1 Tax=Chanos chanos TaxID=29144 RepID=A0A6J2WVV9_CHACN|nr:zinc finger HIT domain-containing protein 3 isoform X1 [Chanos chanos]
MQLCGVCSEQVPKYRCPVCRTRYCSLGCYKNHRGTDACQPLKETALPAPVPCQSASPSAANEPWTVDDLLDENEHSDKVPLERLQQLGESEALKGLLRNPHLRQLLASVDTAEDKAQAMKTAMQEPLFVEFADQCLKVVEPSEKEADEEDDGI